MSDGVKLSRRHLLRGRFKAVTPAAQLPWSLPWPAFVADCSRCGDCLTACPEQIIIKGDGGFPELDFSRGECSFCGDCASACSEPLFRPTEQSPWDYIAHIAESCLANGQVYCQRCQDSCETRAIRFIPILGRVPTPSVDAALCTGCGACVADCPVDSIKVASPAAKEHE
ncbi:ferredoxin-type protein NapF [Aeromonas rivuli]|uniref:ferredoxin-type protein NapF n=1 Tax=Aeromonas rivuli TaxID=648794 RepID=UPI0005A7DB03|nr:ferredoxin-type protein NapF [Aeromonas rivuli]